ncbi:MAG: YebC/PmpR family DNA-binding transcriptional regulator [Mycoplasmoidaceae bacterium]|nr:YebC/PmpR family DNA-binding transcriptional regulator [Mycoplasmoidaceae bacterium]
MKAAVKVGGPNPEANPRLKAAIEKALSKNLSRDSIERNINGSQKDQTELVNLQYECYGPNGIQIIVEALTDNPNRTASNLRGYLSKFDAEIAKANSVKMFFDKYGVITIVKDANTDLDKIMECTLEFKIVDIIEYEDAFEVLTEPDDFYKTKDALKNQGFNVFEADIKMVSQSKINSLPEKIKEKYDRFIASCEDDDDIQSVVTNYEEL